MSVPGKRAIIVLLFLAIGVTAIVSVQKNTPLTGQGGGGYVDCGSPGAKVGDPCFDGATCREGTCKFEFTSISCDAVTSICAPPTSCNAMGQCFVPRWCCNNERGQGNCYDATDGGMSPAGTCDADAGHVDYGNNPTACTNNCTAPPACANPAGAGGACPGGMGPCPGLADCCCEYECTVALDCVDANFCTRDYCDLSTHTCVHDPISCPRDSNVCTVEMCVDPSTGACGSVPVNCNDNNACTTDSCDPASGCKNALNETDAKCICKDPANQVVCGKGVPVDPAICDSDPSYGDACNSTDPTLGVVCCAPGACDTTPDGKAICRLGSDDDDSGSGGTDADSTAGGVGGTGGAAGDTGTAGDSGDTGGSNRSVTRSADGGGSSDCTAIRILYGCPCDITGDGKADGVCTWGACDPPPSNCVGGSSVMSSGSKGSGGSNGSAGSGASGNSSSAATASSVLSDACGNDISNCCEVPPPTAVDGEQCVFGVRCCSDGVWDCAQNVQTGDPNAACVRKGKGTELGTICPVCSSSSFGESVSSSSALSASEEPGSSETSSVSSFVQGGICCMNGQCVIAACADPFESTDECSAVCALTESPSTSSSSSVVVAGQSSVSVGVSSSPAALPSAGSSSFAVAGLPSLPSSISSVSSHTPTYGFIPNPDDDGDGDNDDGVRGNGIVAGEGIREETPTLLLEDEAPKSAVDLARLLLVAAAPVCGDGILGTSEECDDRNRRDGDGCSGTCLLEIGICGDGIVQSLLGEQCEQSTHDQSLPYRCKMCLFHSLTCGDGTVDPGEECDEGTRNSTRANASCRPDCHTYRCGDGIADIGEGCDDGNRLNGDGCDAYCLLPSTAVAAQTDASDIPFTQAQYAGSESLPFPFQTFPGVFPGQLPMAQLRPLMTNVPSTAQTGPAVIAVIGAGAAAGWSFIRNKSKK